MTVDQVFVSVLVGALAGTFLFLLPSLKARARRWKRLFRAPYARWQAWRVLRRRDLNVESRMLLAEEYGETAVVDNSWLQIADAAGLVPEVEP